MASQVQSELDAFEVFLKRRLPVEHLGPVEDALHEFRARQAEIERLREELRPALEELDRGEGVPLDMDEIRAAVFPDGEPTE